MRPRAPAGSKNTSALSSQSRRASLRPRAPVAAPKKRKARIKKSVSLKKDTRKAEHCFCCCGKYWPNEYTRNLHLGSKRRRLSKKVLKKLRKSDFFCTCCEKTFNGKAALRLHYEEHRRALTASELKKHKSRKKQTPCLCCCGRMFNTQYSRNLHLGSKRRYCANKAQYNSRFFCSCCEQSFKSKSALQSHYSEHGRVAADTTASKTVDTTDLSTSSSSDPYEDYATDPSTPPSSDAYEDYTFVSTDPSTPPSSDPYEGCEYICCCGMPFRTRDEWDEHLSDMDQIMPKSSVKDGTFVCKCCRQRFDSNEALQFHYSEQGRKDSAFVDDESSLLDEVQWSNCSGLAAVAAAADAVDKRPDSPVSSGNEWFQQDTVGGNWPLPQVHVEAPSHPFTSDEEFSDAEQWLSTHTSTSSTSTTRVIHMYV